MRPKLGHTLADTKIQSVKDVCALFGRKESNSARRANTARLRAITGEGYGENAPLSERARGYVSRICYCAYAHAEGMDAPLSSLRDTFPSRGRLGYASKFYVNITWVRRSCIPTIGMQASRQCSPQARQVLPAGAKKTGLCYHKPVHELPKIVYNKLYHSKHESKTIFSENRRSPPQSLSYLYLRLRAASDFFLRFTLGFS